MANAAHRSRAELLEGSHAGRHVGRYRLITEIAQGGMASVYLAIDTESDARLTAIKIIRPELHGDADLVRMFFDEACLASQIRSPNTARVLAYGSEGALHYLAMDYLLGETWQQVLHQAAKSRDGQTTRLPVLLARVLHEVALGLHAAHEAKDVRGCPLGVVHRDVSPQNVMVGYDGRVHVLDFGIAKAESRVQSPGDGEPVQGRFAYMAPEQMRGMSVDRRADLWSLGVLLWEGLTCRRLFRRDSDAETIMATAYADIPRADAIEPGAPLGLCRIAERLLQRDRDKRPSTALAVAGELARYLQAEQAPPNAHALQGQMHALFGSRGEEKRRSVDRLRRRFSRPIVLAQPLLRADGMPTDLVPPLAPSAPKVSGVRARKRADARDEQRSSPFSEAPTKPRLEPAPAEATGGGSRAITWWLIAATAASGLSAYLWLAG